MRGDFTYDHNGDAYICPAGKVPGTTGRLVNDGATRLYRASKFDCEPGSLRMRCYPKAPARKIPRCSHEGTRDMARNIAKTDAYETSRRNRKKVEMLFARRKRILKLGRLRLRRPNGAKDEFLLAATAQTLRKLTKLGAKPPPTPQPA